MSYDNYVTIKENFLVVLDSRNASILNNGSLNSSLSFNFEDAIKRDDKCISLQCAVLNFSIPNSIYIINNNNNVININDTLYTFTNGNYNALTFITAFNNLISGYALTLNKITNIFTITNTNSNDFNVQGNIMSIIGGSYNTIYSSTSGKCIFPYQCNFNGLNSLNIYFSNINTRNIDSFTKSNSSLIQSVFIDPNSSQISYNKTNEYFITINQSIIDYIQIDIRDDINNYIDFNNQHWNMTLVFYTIKDVPRFIEDDFHYILKNGYNPTDEND